MTTLRFKINLPLLGGTTTYPQLNPPINPSANSSSLFVQLPAFTPQQLYDMFTSNHDSPNAENTVVASAWYGKQATASYHEFIVIHVEDLTMPGHKNCMVIDRNPNNLGASNRALLTLWGNARDVFRISYDGNLTQLLNGCQLAPHMILEEMHIQPDQPLPLFKLVLLVYHISRQHRRYNFATTNCYWFPGLIWECLRKMCPTAKYEVIVPGKRGRFSYIRVVTNPVQVRSVLRRVQETLESDNPESSLHPNDPLNETSEDIAMEEIGLVLGNGARTSGRRHYPTSATKRKGWTRIFG